MFCDVRNVIEKDEQYARGWLRLYESRENTSVAAEMGQYAVNLQKLKQEHEERCIWCRQKSDE